MQAKKMYAYLNKTKEQGGLQLVELPVPLCKPNQALIKISAVGLNFRDLRIFEGNYTFKFKYDTIIGSDASGTVVKVGNSVSDFWIGKDVIINPNVLWGSNDDVPSEEFSILGTPENGVFCEYIALNVDRLVVKPQHLNAVQAAALPLTGITAYRAIFTKAQIKSNDNVLITGVSGGVAQIALQFCNSLGAHCWVTTSNQDKAEKALKLGAVGVTDYTKEDIVQALGKVNFDVVIDCSGGFQINSLLKLLKPMGKLVLYGAMNGKTDNFDLFTLYYNQLQVLGTLMGNDKEFQKMIDFVSESQITPIIDCVLPFSAIQMGFDILKQKKHFGKIILTL
jgi:NADPH:quinone reductase-like Zn-dependent oxidoreductase